MYAQVLYAKVKPEHEAAFKSQITKWNSTHAKTLPGVEKVIACREVAGLGRWSVVIIFKDKAALDAFSAHAPTQREFEDAKAYFGDFVRYFDATVEAV